MKTVDVSKREMKLDALLSSSQRDRVVLTRGGKPSAVLIGIESYDDEDLELAGSADFWKLIESRRGGKSIPLSSLRAALAKKNSPVPIKAKSTGSPSRSGKQNRKR
jgi:PHD/YefM family antitoxin component YafN of YafNO toxin-antitoxin module